MHFFHSSNVKHRNLTPDTSTKQKAAGNVKPRNLTPDDSTKQQAAFCSGVISATGIMLWHRQLSNRPKLGLQTSCLLHMHNSSHSTHFVSALTLLCREGIILPSDQQQQKSCVLQKTVWSHMLGKMVPFCAWATFVPETFVVFSEPQYLLLCVVDDSLVLITLVCNHPSHATTLFMQPP